MSGSDSLWTLTLLALATAGALSAEQAPSPAASPFLIAHDLPYLEGGDPNLQSLDVYAPRDAHKLPVLIYVHGGGLLRGDKTRVGEKPEFFCSRGWVLVSINYRLSPRFLHPAHIVDTAAAVAWVAREIDAYGGDPERLALIGHSAGAFLGGLLSTDERRLAAHGLGLDTLRAVVLLDGHTYDLESRLREAQRTMPEVLDEPISKFGEDPETWRDATALHHVSPDKAIPPILLVAAGVQFQHWPPGRESKRFLVALWEAGVPTEYYLAEGKNHGAVNRDLTAGGELSRVVLDFLDRHVGEP